MKNGDTEVSIADPLTRRTALKLAGTTGLTGLVAGCSDDSGGTDGDENGDEDGVSPDPAEWEGVSEIELGAETSGWQGLSPDQIDGDDNPPLLLFEGEQYSVTWENFNGEEHNFELRNETGEVVDGHSTDLITDQGETQTYEFEATSEMAQYVCEPHQSTMSGEIQIETTE